MGAVSEITDDSFQAEVIDSQIPVMVDFWAPWCGPCRQIAPMLNELATENQGTFKIVKINIDENSNYAMQFQVDAIPTMIIFKGGQQVERIQGARPKAFMQQVIDTLKT